MNKKLQKKLVEDPSLADIYKVIANIHLQKQDLSQALMFFNRSLNSQLQAKPPDEKAISETYSFIKSIYLKNEHFDKSSLSTKTKHVNGVSSKASSMNSSSSTSAKLIEDKHFEKRHIDQASNYFHQLLDNQLEKLPFGDPSLTDYIQSYCKYLFNKTQL